MNKIKVAIVHYHFAHGGAEHMVASLASFLDKDKFEVVVFCIYGNDNGTVMERSVRDSGARIVYLNRSIGDSAVKGVVSVWKALSAYKPDIVHTHLGALYYCLPWALAQRRRLVHTIHNEPDKELASPRLRRLMILLYSRKQITPIAISKYNQVLISEFYGLNIDSIPIINNPVNLDHFKRHIGTRDEPKYDFVNVAGMRPQKNQAMLLRAFKHVLSACPTAKLCFVGDGSEAKELRSLTRRLGIQASVVFKGALDDVRDVLWKSRCFVLSSDYEGLPLSALEAMACGLPIISTDVGGMRDIVIDNGLLVPAHAEEKLADAMKTLLLHINIDQYASLSMASIRVAESFDVRTVTRKYENLYLESLGGC